VPPACRFLLPHTDRLHPWHRQHLEWSGIPLDRVVWFDPRTRVQPDELHVVPRDLSGILGLRAAVLDHLGITPAAERHVYISRRDAQCRRVVNEPEQTAVFLQKGVETHTLRGMAAADQVRLFAAARTIIAPTGAALVHLLFAPQGAQVIELFPAGFEREVLHVYQPICDLLGLRYRRVDCESIPNLPEPDLLLRRETIEEIHAALV
jgi:hypothetical protein